MLLSLRECHYAKDYEGKQASGMESIKRSIYIWVVRVSKRIGVFGILRILSLQTQESSAVD
jgi:hypothetical protein